ncbi:hypothetical protein HDU96_010849 [Phlyctochytrium bullatum]|nr:hypothetical protein HDU96_010849 [Phlyctochytrium bullatum]
MGETWLFDCGEGTQHQLICAPSHWPHAHCTHLSNAAPPTTPPAAASLPPPPRIKSVNKVFLTHLHGDHCYGLPGLLCTASQTVKSVAAGSAAAATDGEDETVEERPPIEVYGPRGTRMYLRNALGMTMSRLGCRYVVHELHPAASPESSEDSAPRASQMPPHPDELPGRDIALTLQPNSPAHPDTLPPTWTDFPHPGLGHWTLFSNDKFTVHAAPIAHTVPTVGYIVRECATRGRLRAELAAPVLQRNKAALGLKNPLVLLAKLKAGETLSMPDGTELRPEEMVEPDRPGRCVVVLGDTSDPAGMEAAMGGDAAWDGCDLLVHEATNACLGEDLVLNGLAEMKVDGGNGDGTVAVAALRVRVRETAMAHGHSTPEMAGEVAKKWGARKLVLNHFSSRYSGDVEDPEARSVMEEIRMLAVEAFGSEDVVTARDFLCVGVPRRK